MSYLDSALMNGEEVVHKGRVHWFIFVPGLTFLAFGIFLFSSAVGAESPDDGAGPAIFGFFLIFLSIFVLIKAFLVRISTELAVTTKRVIAKTGFIKRKTVELNHGKVESFNVDQSVVGRLFGFGTVVICGTGGGKTPIPAIENPMQFRREAMETIDKVGAIA
jgi:uncharacterized membrane protein YdbT with pleckstrin-like domain